MSWRVTAVCAVCGTTLSFGTNLVSERQYAADVALDTPTPDTLREMMRAHEANQHGGKA